MVFSKYAIVLLIGGSGMAGMAAAQDLAGQALARSSNCLACHQIDSKRVGPAFKLVAERFAGEDGAADYLAATIRSGGRGRWGAVPMPAQPQVSPEDAQRLAAWILSLANGEHDTDE